MSASSLAELLAGQETATVLSLDENSLDDTGAFGPSAYYYLARWLDSRTVTTASTTALAPETAARARLLYRKAFDEASGIARKEAGLSLIDHLSSASLWDELLSFSAEFIVAIGAEWKAERPRLEALDALGRNAEVSALVTRLGSAYPSEAALDADALAYFGAAANMRAHGKTWAKALRRLLLERPGSDWTARAYVLAQAEPRVRALFSQEELHALAMRDAVWRKNFGLAYQEALLGPHASMGPSSSLAMIADAGKAFLYSGQLKDGEGRFAAVGWTAHYYRARFARALGRWGEAEALFKKTAAAAPTPADADASRWYAADCASRAVLAAASALPVMPTQGSVLEMAAVAKAAAREAALAELIAASKSWRDPATFSDLVDGLYRDALNERDWRLIDDMAGRLMPKLAPDTAARIEYTAARVHELGLVAGSDGEADPEARAAAAAMRFAAVTDSRAAPLYYRALAAWRAGIEPTFIALDASPAVVASSMANDIDETESFIAGIAGFGLGDIALAEAKSRSAALSDDAVRRLAALFSSLGRPDCALRLAHALSLRPSYEPRRSDYELIYPRPYLAEIRSLKLEPRIPECLALGLVRSESVFRADAVSWAGAIGLAQLMPSTAADQAKALGLSSYDLKTPKDNLAIGFAHFAFLLQRADGKPLRAMMAYNAGWGRLKTWVAESGELPDDLMVEALGIEETRQYCRNILQATVMYGELYYGRTVVELVGELVEGDRGDSATQ